MLPTQFAYVLKAQTLLTEWFFFKCVQVKCQTCSSTKGHCCTQTNIVGSVAHHESPLRFYQRSSQFFGRDLPPNQILLTFTLKPTRLQPDEASIFYIFFFFSPTTTPLKYQAVYKNVDICFSALSEFVVGTAGNPKPQSLRRIFQRT